MKIARQLSTKQKKLIALSYERLMAIVATINFGLVAFDLTYIQLRNFWLQGTIQIPLVDVVIKVPILSDRVDTSPVVSWYDPIKGIQPNRDTARYLRQFETLEAQVKKTGYNSPQAQVILKQLRDSSAQMISENPFQGANKSGTLEKIKNLIRDHMERDSAKEAFQQFWTSSYLLSQSDELELFQEKIIPLISTNYYRSIDETGGYTNRFAAFELPFAIIFFLDFLARSILIKMTHTSITFRDAMLWRWYDIFLFVTIFPWLRIIPVTIRLHQAKLLDLEPIRAQFSRGFVASFASELTEVIIIQAINQLQSEVRSGAFAKQLFESSAREYIDINDIDEIETITQRLVEVVVNQVLPTLQPEMKQVIDHNLEQALQSTPIYQNMSRLPGLADFSDRFTEQLSHQLSTLVAEGSQSLYETIQNDTVGADLVNQLVEKFGKSLSAELQQKQTTQELESLVSDFLEEFKLNYVQRLAEEDIEKILEETKRIERSRKH
ncbi:hypothetical protein [Roseofilum casamattae]|uniref:Uridine phosphorylase n=1 Tax=Roseofilum casamattae BLCC-M143 TaxID=3022442 RepID=A0ABT7BSP5_9CYAN|nr:hypothetical protein [Roseofilum casamattae]MDJ1182208.1 hypothetical protein [Roseofilum casamattae BLCC-M143]